jgi:hypothetical protein
MPNRETFKIKPIQKLIMKYYLKTLDNDGLTVDPFVRNSYFKNICDLTNDLNLEIKADYNLEAKEFVKLLADNSVSLFLFDPPYSPRQVKDCYQNIGIKFTAQDALSSFYSLVKDVAKDKVLPGGYSVSLGWNSNGMGKARGFEIVEILMVAHGGNIHDTICTVERKIA